MRQPECALNPQTTARVALVLLVVLSVPLASPAQRAQFSPDEMKQWVTHLASDDLQGRQVFTEGLGVAGTYIAERLREWNVTPAGDRGTYFQTVPVLGMRTRSNSTVTVTANGETRTFRDGQGVTFPPSQGGRQTVSGPVEFVGYGHEFAPMKLDDYAGRDMKGKIALFIGRLGPGMTTTHNRLVNARARHATEVRQAIASIGPVAPAGRGGGAAPQAPAAAGQQPGEGGAASVPGSPGAAPAGGPNAAQRVDFQTTRDLTLLVPPQITVGDEFYEFVFAGSGHRYQDLRALAAKQQPLPAVALRDVSITITVDAEYDRVQTRLTRNVVGLVRGTDSRLRDSYVGLGAHYDHVGYQQFTPAAAAPPAAGRGGGAGNAFAGCPGQARPTPRPGDIISNGADDNASGTSLLLAVAKAFATGQKPKRSLLFVWHTGEESGLFGSRFMADHSVIPIDQMVTMLNVDMVGRNRCDDPAQANTVYLVGSDRISTELHNLSEEATASLRRPLTLDYEFNDVADPESIYTRSDHYSYAAKGIPIIFFTTGLHRDYHYVTDEADKIEYAKMARIAELVHATAARVGNLDRAPARDFAGPRVGRARSGPLR